MSRATAIAGKLHLPPDDLVFSEDLLADQPEPVRRFFLHAVAPGTPLARSVRPTQTGSMLPKPGAGRLDITATEVLTPPLGLVWEARTKIGPVGFHIVDTHFKGVGRLRPTT